MRDIVNELSVDLIDEEDNETTFTKVYIEYMESQILQHENVEFNQLEQMLAPKGSGQDSSLVPQTAKSGKSDELRIMGANIELDQFSLDGISELYLKEQNILELAAYGQNSLLGPF
ncbi:hypothetical protein FGO68_gene1123 [Halteria grandinella]|uniref:Uncharacterized protein n=1 Tax=Halteria grandinella TaxID=5974 RepID=A0A8J8T6B4_HALGN|nr:hypothetical protein FGO68_gene1123 [Halteria grandinella]